MTLRFGSVGGRFRCGVWLQTGKEAKYSIGKREGQKISAGCAERHGQATMWPRRDVSASAGCANRNGQISMWPRRDVRSDMGRPPCGLGRMCKATWASLHVASAGCAKRNRQISIARPCLPSKLLSPDFLRQTRRAPTSNVLPWSAHCSALKRTPKAMLWALHTTNPNNRSH